LQRFAPRLGAGAIEALGKAVRAALAMIRER
jgi:hypothetical protein